MQYVPENGIYVYFRYNDQKTVMVMMNTNEKAEKVSTKRFVERLGSATMGLNIITDAQTTIDGVEVPAKGTLIFEIL
jgi:hypothetical protein